MFDDPRQTHRLDNVLAQASRGVILIDDFFPIVQPHLDRDQDGKITLPDIINFCKTNFPKVSESDVQQVSVFFDATFSISL